MILHGIIRYAKIEWNWTLILINKAHKETKEETLAMWEAHIAFCKRDGLRINLTFRSQDGLSVINAATNNLDCVL
jgi:hypothetical protein